MTDFSDLGLRAETLKAVAATGYTTPTPIQEQAIPVALAGRDVLGIAQTGTGKTAAFTLPMIDRLASGRSRARMPRSLVIAPTRELADQVALSFEKYATGQKLAWVLLIGGVSFDEQLKALDRGVDVLIATPGRLLDLFDRKKLMLMGVEIMVVDEADRMLDMGFIPDLERIFKLTPAARQTLFFSATMPPEITRLTAQFLKDPIRIEASRPATTGENIAQFIARIPSADPKAKRTALRALIAKSDVQNGIVFCNRKTDVDIVAKSLARHGFDAAPIHGDLDQSMRTRTLENFRKGELKILVASDVAARGLDIPAVSHIFNYDVPFHAEDYVHRIGRTGRAGRTGEAFMIVTQADAKAYDKVLKLTKKEPDEVTLDVDWTAVESDERPRRPARTRDARSEPARERSRSRRRDAAPKGDEPVEQDHLAAVVEAAPAEVVQSTPPAPPPTPVPSEPPARSLRPERRPRAEPAAAERAAPRSQREPRPVREDPHDRHEASVVGFGSDVPAFLLLRAAPAPREPASLEE